MRATEFPPVSAESEPPSDRALRDAVATNLARLRRNAGLAVDALANEYVAAPYESRRADLAPEIIPYRFIGAFDGTQLSYDPPIAGAPTQLDRGTIIEVSSATPFVVRSQDEEHPFAMAQMMTTANLEGGSRPGARRGSRADRGRPVRSARRPPTSRDARTRWRGGRGRGRRRRR